MTAEAHKVNNSKRYWFIYWIHAVAIIIRKLLTAALKPIHESTTAHHYLQITWQFKSSNTVKTSNEYVQEQYVIRHLAITISCTSICVTSGSAEIARIPGWSGSTHFSALQFRFGLGLLFVIFIKKKKAGYMFSFCSQTCVTSNKYVVHCTSKFY